MKRTVIAAALLFGSLAQSTAIELSLEENRAERGSIGYIDMQRLFKQFPETIRAKENFEEVVRQAEEQINLRKVEIIRLRNELSQLRIERQFMGQMQTPMTISTASAAAVVAPASAPTFSEVASKTAGQPPASPAPSVSTAAAAPAPTVPAATASAPQPVLAVKQVAQAQPAEPAPKAEEPRRLPALPGFGDSSPSPLPGFGSAPTAATVAATPPPAPKKDSPLAVNVPEVSTAAAPAQQARAAAPEKKPEPLVINIPGVSTAPIVVQPSAAAAAASAPAAQAPEQKAPGLNPAVVELDAKIALKEKELAQKEAEFKDYQASSEKNLVDLESRKTEILLGKIHKAVQEIARREGVSVVVDKTNILYGHDAVDLTDKVLKYLRGT